MRRILFVIGILLLTSFIFAESGSFGQKKYFEARLGAMFPWGTGPGFRGGALFGLNIDQLVSVNTSLDYYRTSFSTKVDLSNANTGIVTTGIGSETLGNLLIWMLNARVDIPVVIADVIVPYGQIGLGYEVMINTYKSASDQKYDEKTYLFGEFGLELELGMRMKLGERSALLLAVNYNFCSVGKSRNSTDTVSVGEKIDVSGFGVMAGINFEL
jgi:opacity protein-like surface antigen